MTSLRFERGTLELAAGALDVPHAIWDPRETRRVAADRFSAPVGLVGDGPRSVERVTVMTFESAYRHMDKLGDRLGLLVVDEVHHFGSGARVEALEASTAVIKVPMCLEVEERADDDARTRAFLEMRRTFMRLYPGADVATMLRGLRRTFEGRRALRDRARALELACFPRAKRSLLQTLLARHRDDRTDRLRGVCRERLVAAKDNVIPVITGETGAKKRQEILTSFREGKVRAIASARVLNEGIDVPDARVAIIVAIALGAREHVQRIGRVLRPGPEKHAVVYELITTDTSDARRASVRAEHAPQPSP